MENQNNIDTQYIETKKQVFFKKIIIPTFIFLAALAIIISLSLIVRPITKEIGHPSPLQRKKTKNEKIKSKKTYLSFKIQEEIKKIY
ncbi:MAG: hypothetical protein GY679_03110 [Mycoplasma sp.]|nr:hypothetical protein [Mycoplasma sp.]